MGASQRKEGRPLVHRQRRHRHHLVTQATLAEARLIVPTRQPLLAEAAAAIGEAQSLRCSRNNRYSGRLIARISYSAST